MDTEYEEFKKPRLLFLDNIKLLFAILVIFNHARVTYEGSGWWYYIEDNTLDLFSAIFFQFLASLGGLFQASLLVLFFLLAGFLTPKSYDRKGVSAFWKERLLRLGIPILLFILLINPTMFYLLAILGIQPWVSHPNLQGSLLDYYFAQLQSLEQLIDFLTDTGPMWFLFVLLLLTCLYTLWRLIKNNLSLQQYIPKEFNIPKYPFLLLLAIILGCATFIVRIFVPIDRFPLGIPFGYMIQYIMMFSIGIVAIRYDWFEKMTKDHIKIWSYTIIAAVVLFFLYFFMFIGIDSDYSVVLGGANPHALVFTLTDNIISMGMIFVLIPIFYLKFNKQGVFLQKLSDSSFHMYLIHAPILVTVSLVFAPLPLFPIVKLAIVFP
ncbi:MAG: acyltransferase family protein, partial [Candidatus Kariarchaeaceae archaeon]